MHANEYLDMMKRLLTGMLVPFLFFFTSNALVACSGDDPVEELTEVPPRPSDEDENNVGEENDDYNGNNHEAMERNMVITVNGTSFAATLEDNGAARAFAAMLPLTLDMSELNGNEKYHYLDGSLPTDSYRPGTIQAGDLMLYGSSCVVLFYETFSSGYSYTRLGRIDHPDGLAAAVGSGNVRVGFAMAEHANE